jgi:hypothetical protein
MKLKLFSAAVCMLAVGVVSSSCVSPRQKEDSVSEAVGQKAPPPATETRPPGTVTSPATSLSVQPGAAPRGLPKQPEPKPIQAKQWTQSEILAQYEYFLRLAISRGHKGWDAHDAAVLALRESDMPPDVSTPEAVRIRKKVLGK